jgi:hypothetical protein
MDLASVQNKLRKVAELSLLYKPDHKPSKFEGFPIEFRGYSEATIKLAVCKTCPSVKFAHDQAAFMDYLGICPQVYAIEEDCYCMEFLLPVDHNPDSLVVQERILEGVWEPTRNLYCISDWQEVLKEKINVEVPDWALEEITLIHGDPTLDNVLMDVSGRLYITDPIPTQWLGKPSIKAVDHSKMLQSFLGWEVVLRGLPLIEYAWPKFMQDIVTAHRAVFWAMVSIKRIAYRDYSDGITEWANLVARELEECVH